MNKYSGGMKICSSCELYHPIELFGKDKNSSDGLTYSCKESKNKYYRDKAKQNPEIYKKRNANYKEYRKNYYNKPENKLKYKNQTLKNTFGISLDEFNKLLEKQNGVCAICFKPESTKRNKTLAVDHDHKTGKIRGLLCSHCNRGLGLLKDSPEIIMEAIKYLGENK